MKLSVRSLSPSRDLWEHRYIPPSPATPAPRRRRSAAPSQSTFANRCDQAKAIASDIFASFLVHPEHAWLQIIGYRSAKLNL